MIPGDKVFYSFLFCYNTFVFVFILPRFSVFFSRTTGCLGFPFSDHKDQNRKGRAVIQISLDISGLQKQAFSGHPSARKAERAKCFITSLLHSLQLSSLKREIFVFVLNF